MAEDRLHRELEITRIMLAGISARRQSLTHLQQQLARGVIDPAVAVFSDLHGNFLRFAQFLRMEEFVSVSRVILLGDYMDRGPNGVTLSDMVRDLVEHQGAIALLGNHEEYIIRTMLGEGSKGAFFDWIANGGLAVLEEEGIIPHDLESRFVQSAARRAIRSSPGTELESFDERFPGLLDDLFAASRRHYRLKRIARWYQQNLRLYYRDDNGNLFIHAGIPVDEQGDVQLEYQGRRGLEALDAAQNDLRRAEDPGDELFRFLGVGHTILNVRRDEWIAPILRHDWAERVLDQLGADRIFFGHSAHDGDLFNLGNRAFCLDRSMCTNQGCGLLMNQDGIVVHDFCTPSSMDPSARTILRLTELARMVDDDLRQLGERQRTLAARHLELAGEGADSGGESPPAFSGGVGSAGVAESASVASAEAAAPDGDDLDYPLWFDIDFGRLVRRVCDELRDDGTIPALGERKRYEFIDVDQTLRVRFQKRPSRELESTLEGILVEILKNAYEEAPDGVIRVRLAQKAKKTWTLSIENEGGFDREAQQQLLDILQEHVRAGNLSICHFISDLSVKPDSPLQRFFMPVQEPEEALRCIDQFIRERGLRSIIFIHGLGRNKQRPGDELGRGGVGLTGVFWTMTAKLGGSVEVDDSQEDRTIMNLNLRADATGRGGSFSTPPGRRDPA